MSNDKTAVSIRLDLNDPDENIKKIANALKYGVSLPNQSDLVKLKGKNLAMYAIGRFLKELESESKDTQINQPIEKASPKKRRSLEDMNTSSINL